MNKDLVKYINCLKDQEITIYKYQKILEFLDEKINSLGRSENISRPYFTSPEKPKPIPKGKYIITGICCIIFGCVLVSSFLVALGNLNIKIPYIDEIRENFQLYNTNKDVLFILAISLIIAISFYGLPWIKYFSKCRKQRKEFNEEYQNAQSAYEAELKKYENDLKSDEDRVSREMQQRDYCIKEKNSVIDKISECKKVLNQLYDINIVFPKYRNMVAIATICEYLLSRRCDKLTGPDGAYNLYEKELRSQRIIDRLDVIVDKLEEIKQTQYLIYDAITTSESILSELKKEFEQISEYSRISAFNSEVMARDIETIKLMTAFDNISEY